MLHCDDAPYMEEHSGPDGALLKQGGRSGS
jgi:hypothetical protein